MTKFMTGLFVATTLSVTFTVNAARPSFTPLQQQVSQLQTENNAQEEDIEALKIQVNENTLDLEGIKLIIADSEPPQILIDAPATTVGGNELVTTTFSDDQGLFKYSVGSERERVSYESEIEIVVERSVVPEFGKDTLLTAYATDRSGNAATATHVIQSETGITPGIYVLDEPLNETISGSGCNLQYQDFPSLEADRVYVYGAFLQPNEMCDYRANEDPENTVACISVSVQGTSNSSLSGYAKSAITSIGDTVISADTLNSSGSGSGDSYKTYTQMNAEFYDTIPATVSIDMTLRCESTTYGTTTFGPYQLHGTLQQ